MRRYIVFFVMITTSLSCLSSSIVDKLEKFHARKKFNALPVGEKVNIIWSVLKSIEAVTDFYKLDDTQQFELIWATRPEIIAPKAIESEQSSDKSTQEKLRDQRSNNVATYFVDYKASKNLIPIYNAISKKLDKLSRADVRRSHTTVNSCILELEEICTQCKTHKVNLNFQTELTKCNDMHNNFYARTFPLQWQYIMSTLQPQSHITSAKK